MYSTFSLQIVASQKEIKGKDGARKKSRDHLGGKGTGDGIRSGYPADCAVHFVSLPLTVK